VDIDRKFGKFNFTEEQRLFFMMSISSGKKNREEDGEKSSGNLLQHYIGGVLGGLGIVAGTGKRKRKKFSHQITQNPVRV